MSSGYTVRLLKSGRFQAVVRDPDTNKQVGIGSFPTEEDAVSAALGAIPGVVARQGAPKGLADAVAVAVLDSVGPGATVADVKRITKAVIGAVDAWFLSPIARTKPRTAAEPQAKPDGTAVEIEPTPPKPKRKAARPTSVSGRVRPERQP